MTVYQLLASVGGQDGQRKVSLLRTSITPTGYSAGGGDDIPAECLNFIHQLGFSWSEIEKALLFCPRHEVKYAFHEDDYKECPECERECKEQYDAENIPCNADGCDSISMADCTKCDKPFCDQHHAEPYDGICKSCDAEAKKNPLEDAKASSMDRPHMCHFENCEAESIGFCEECEKPMCVLHHAQPLDICENCTPF